MTIYNSSFQVSTTRRLEIVDLTSKVSDTVRKSGLKNGIATVYLPHATAAIAVNEHDQDLWEDIIATLSRLVPIEGDYRHNAKYGGWSREQNAHAHIINCMLKPDTTIPVQGGEMTLGTWQSILLIELDGPRKRRIIVQVMGE